MGNRSKQELIVRNRKLALLIIVSSVIFACITFSIKSNASSPKEEYIYYTSYEIQPGDTLWSIANEYAASNHCTTDSYINKIKSLNHILDDEITAGDYLIVSYYSYE